METVELALVAMVPRAAALAELTAGCGTYELPLACKKSIVILVSVHVQHECQTPSGTYGPRPPYHKHQDRSRQNLENFRTAPPPRARNLNQITR